jgi:hypothetical protein
VAFIQNCTDGYGRNVWLRIEHRTWNSMLEAWLATTKQKLVSTETAKKAK